MNSQSDKKSINNNALSIEKTVIKHSSEESKSSIAFSPSFHNED